MTTLSFLLYLTDCGTSGETAFLEAKYASDFCRQKARVGL